MLLPLLVARLLNIQELVSLDAFKVIPDDMEAKTSGFRCFECLFFYNSCFCNLFIVFRFELLYVCLMSSNCLFWPGQSLKEIFF